MPVLMGVNPGTARIDRGVSMRICGWVILLGLLVFLVALLVVPVYASSEQHSPTMIIPTNYRLMLMDMVNEEHAASPVATPTPDITTLSAKSENSALVSDTDDSALLSAGLKRDASRNYMGRGYVQTNFDVSFNNQGTKIDNHEMFSARGLFDVHVTHGLN